MDRRRYPRNRCTTLARVYPVGGALADAGLAQLQDFSRRGIGFTFERRYDADAVLAVEWTVSGRSAPAWFLVRVACVEQVDENHWRHGCELLAEMSREDLLALLAASPVPRRLAKRSSAQPQAMVWTEVDLFAELDNDAVEPPLEVDAGADSVE